MDPPVSAVLLELGHDLVQERAGLGDDGVGLRLGDIGAVEDAHSIGEHC